MTIGPILFVLWLILGIVYNFTSSTICVAIACSCSALVYLWVDFITKHIE